MAAQSPQTSFLRQLNIFNPETFNHVCHIIGVGAVGSRLAENLSRLGIKRLELYDKDTVQPHNIPTGAFSPYQTGFPKVQAVKKNLLYLTTTEVTAHCQMVEDKILFQGIVFLCVDSMDSRRQIWQDCIKQNPNIPLMIEIRIGPQEGRIYTVNPLDLQEIDCWEQLCYPSGHDQELPCTERAIITTVNMIAALAARQLILWHCQLPYPNSIILGLQGEPLLKADKWM